MNQDELVATVHVVLDRQRTPPSTPARLAPLPFEIAPPVSPISSRRRPHVPWSADPVRHAGAVADEQLDLIESGFRRALDGFGIHSVTVQFEEEIDGFADTGRDGDDEMVNECQHRRGAVDPSV